MNLTCLKAVGIVFLSGVMIIACNSDEHDNEESGAANLQQADKDFLTRATSFSRVEMQAGSLAEVKGHDDAVREFGTQMVTEHQQTLDELKEISRALNYPLPVLLVGNDEEMKILDVLDTLQGPDFDTAYLKNEVVAYGRSEFFYKSQVKYGKNKLLVEFAKKMVPIAHSRQLQVSAIEAVLNEDHSSGRVTKPIKK